MANGKVKYQGRMNLGELLDVSSEQIRLLSAGKGDVSVSNAIAGHVRGSMSVLNMAIKLHKMGSSQNVLQMPRELSNTPPATAKK